MIRISKRAVEKLKEAHKNGQKKGFRVFISGLG
jgi:Fe-S cluster assembly iron-binding protein IscA